MAEEKTRKIWVRRPDNMVVEWTEEVKVMKEEWDKAWEEKLDAIAKTWSKEIFIMVENEVLTLIADDLDKKKPLTEKKETTNQNSGKGDRKYLKF